MKLPPPQSVASSPPLGVWCKITRASDDYHEPAMIDIEKQVAHWRYPDTVLLTPTYKAANQVMHDAKEMFEWLIHQL